MELAARPFAKSTLQEFWAQLIVHEQAAVIFRRSLALARQRGRFRAKSGERRKLTVALVEAAGLLSRVLAQDVERQADGPARHQGVTKDRLVSVHDPEMRHGRKSASTRFDGHTAAVAVDADEQVITAVTVLPGNAQDHEQALARVEESAAATGCAVAETLADGAYGDGETRQVVADAGRRLVAKVPAEQHGGRFTTGDFTLDLEAGTCRCPGGQQRRDCWPRPGGGGLFRCAADVCAACPLRAQCLKGQGGRRVRIHPQEPVLHAARAEQASPAGREHRTRRQVVEHRIARLVHLGIRQARDVGRTKTLFHLLMAAAVATLTLLANTATEQRADAIIAGACCALLAVILAPRCHPDGPQRPNSEGRWLALRPGGATLRHASTWPSTFRTPTSRPGF